MFQHIMNIVIAVAFGLVLNNAAYCQWEFGEIYSTADGSVQFIGLRTSIFTGWDGISEPPVVVLPILAGQTLIAGDGRTEHRFTFASNVSHYDGGCDVTEFGAPYCGFGAVVLVATQGFADLKLVKPDFVVPNGFLFLSNGSVRLGASEIHYDSLPTDGEHAWDEGQVLQAGAFNNAGESYLFTTLPIGPGFTGAWYDPAQSGHGLFIEVLPSSRFLAWWFTFNPAGTEQAWVGGVGTYAGNTATISTVILPTGGRWIPNFDPSQIVNNPWGTLTFTFTDCNHGKVDFNSIAGYGTGSMNLTRLTQPAALACP